MFAMPLLVGLGASHIINRDAMLFILTAFCFFLLRYPLMRAIKSRAPDARLEAWRWSALYAALTGLSGAWLLVSSQLWALIPIGAFGLAVLAVYLLLAARRGGDVDCGRMDGDRGAGIGSARRVPRIKWKV